MDFALISRLGKYAQALKAKHVTLEPIYGKSKYYRQAVFLVPPKRGSDTWRYVAMWWD